MRTFAQERGLSAPPVWALAQDPRGFIWIAAEGGLYRFDGDEIRLWAPEAIDGLVEDVVVSPSGVVIALAGDGRLFQVSDIGVREIETPWSPRLHAVRADGSLAWDRRGTLWMLFGDTVGYRRFGAWQTLGTDAFGGEVPRMVAPTDFGGVLVATGRALWRVRPDAAPECLFRGSVIADAVEPEAGRVLVLLNVEPRMAPRVVEVTSAGERDLLPHPGPLAGGRAIGLLERNGTLWLAVDRYLAAIRPGGHLEVLGSEDGVESGGPLLVDHEGSLWMGSYVGLHQYPEPDTHILGEAEGLPSRHTRFLAHSDSTLWVLTWGGPATIRRHGAGYSVAATRWDTRSRICTEEDGTAWTADASAIIEIRGAAVTRRTDLPRSRVDGCAPARGGGVWIGSAKGVWRVSRRQGDVRILTVPPVEAGETYQALLQDEEDRLWIRAGTRLCHAPASSLRSGEQPAWSCADPSAPSGVTSLVQLADGRLWASADQGGMFVLDGRKWIRVSLDGVAARTVFGIVPSPRGDAWVVGAGMVVRGHPTDDGHVEVVEKLTAWHGVPAAGASDLFEDRDGDVWLATNRGVVHVPAAVRFATPPVPPVALVEGRVDGHSVALSRRLVLSHDQNRLELSFAALSFRDRTDLRHQVRLGPDRPWSESSGASSFRWVDLPAGTYHAEYRASNDGRTWSAHPVGFSFEVRPPWYATGWFLALLAVAATGLIALVHRARVGYLLGLEEQRTRIAMDLHDHVGSGLASVGILSGVMAEGRLEDEERRRTAAEIAEVAEDLGHSLSDIVWSLDPQTATMEELASRLAEHGERLFAADEPLFMARFPERWPATRSSVMVRRNVLLIGLEALHNAARHAGARHVVLSLGSHERGTWEMAVRDDGAGIGLAAAALSSGSGRGLEGMARRAEAMGARLEVGPAEDGGTLLTLRFHPEHGAVSRGWQHAPLVARALARMIMRARPPR